MGYDHLPFTDDEREQYLRILAVEADLVTPERDIQVVDSDPDDDMFIECAIAGGASFLVSGDTHLLELGSFEDVAIVTPAKFLERSG